MTRLALDAMAAVLAAVLAAIPLACGSAYAQAGGMSISPGTPLGLTSPLGIGATPPVAPTGIPMGTTELPAPALSPFISGVSPMAPVTCGASSAGASAGAPTALFDGSGVTGSAMGPCATSGGGSAAGSAPMGSSGTGRGSSAAVAPVGIPMGSTEMGVGGLSPLPGGLTTNPSAPVMSATPLPVTPPSSPSAPLSTPGNTTPCQETATGVSRAGGPVSPATAFGAPLRGPALGVALDRGCAP
jgi:hypothetical protein